MCFSIAVAILLQQDNKRRNHFLDYAKQMLAFFVSESAILYGDTFVSYNVHSLLHIGDDCSHFADSLNNLSAFPFENALFKLKRKILGSKNKLVELCKKIQEQPTKRRLTQRQLTKISLKQPNNCFVISETSFIVLDEKQCDGSFRGRVIHHSSLSNIFGSVADSRDFGIGSISQGTFFQL